MTLIPGRTHRLPFYAGLREPLVEDMAIGMDDLRKAGGGGADCPEAKDPYEMTRLHTRSLSYGDSGVELFASPVGRD